VIDLNEFFITAAILYAFSIFLVNLRIKIEVKKIRTLKVLAVGLAVFSVITFIDSLKTVSGLYLATEIVALFFIVVFIIYTFIDEINHLFKKLNIAKNSKKPQLINNELASALAESVSYLSRRKIGALITVEKKIRLTDIVDQSLLLNADVSKELITSIFMPNTPLHDGAIIIRDNKIICAKAYFPSSEKTDLPMNYGTRHRAALGISEQSDAFTIVVSEETGRVSVTIDGKMEYNVTKEGLNLYLENVLKIR
jgi:diadenylate cyclase